MNSSCSLSNCHLVALIYLFFFFFLTGRFLAEVTQQVFSDLEASKYQVRTDNFVHFLVIECT